MTSAWTSGIRVDMLRVANFRSLVNVEVALEALTLLVGPNNAGKTSLLDAAFVAIGAGRKQVGPEDIYIASNESTAPKNREAIIDIRILPVNNDGKIQENFGAGSYWTSLWGTGISQDDDLNDFVGIRTRIRYNPAQDSYIMERNFLREWKTTDWTDSEVGRRVSVVQIEPIQLQYIDAKRDLDDDFRRPGSFWRRLTEDLGLEQKDVEHFENALSELNVAIIEKSQVLKYLSKNLSDIDHVVADGKSDVCVSPVARRLRDLSKGVDVTFSSEGTQAFPLARHGMGTRSLASLLVFRAFAGWKRIQTEKENELIHPFLALEEPEAHLHPHAQRALHKQIVLIPGQRIVSTHSAYFAGQAEIYELRLVTKSDGKTRVKSVNVNELSAEDHRKLRRMVIATRGDLLFARAMVFFEGETEEQALPIWAESYWSSNAHEMGVSFVGTGGDGAYFPFIWLAHNFDIKWYIFSDAEQPTISRLNAALSKAGLPEHDKCDNIVCMDAGLNFESQLLKDGYSKEMEAAILKIRGGNGIEDYIAELHGKKAKGGGLRDYKSKGGRDRAIMDCIRREKTKFGPTIAEITCRLSDHSRRIPSKVNLLFRALDKDLRAQTSNESHNTGGLG